MPKVDILKYQKTMINKKSSYNNELLSVKFRYKEPDGKKSKLIKKLVNDRTIKLSRISNDLRFLTAVAGFGLLLRESKYKGDITYEKVITIAKSATDRDEEGYRSEFIELVKKCKLLSNKS